MEQLANLWVSRLLAPAFAFWAAGVFAWVWAHDRGHALDRLDRFITHTNATALLAMSVAGLLAITLSGVIAKPLALPVLRILEGYWWGGLKWPRAFFVGRERARLARTRARWLSLAAKGLDTLSPDLIERYSALDEQLQYLPDDPNLLMPTRLGNILRAAEGYPQQRYGLNSIVCWPRLWLLLPEPVKEELTRARAQLDGGALVVFWCLASLIWSALWLWWLAPVAVVVAGATYYYWLLGQARVYADLFRATYDVHRQLLYAALGFTRPHDLDAERSAGEALTLFLWRGELPERSNLPIGANPG